MAKLDPLFLIGRTEEANRRAFSHHPKPPHRRSMMMRIAPLILLLLAPAAAEAQGCSRTPPDADEELPAIAATFSADPETARNRGPEITPLAPADTTYVVRDDSVCQAVLDVVIPEIRRGDPTWAGHREGHYTATVLRLGPYYTVSLLPERESGSELRVSNNADGSVTIQGVAHSRNPFVVLRASDLGIVRIFY
ncbi:hypothetical protein [Longimicrobium terrae]|uniref:Uncharacterized protein n=1 Tax=Longimicrobium terrae TaxID=1639882 RepID=A0A841H6L1_9BACT|nr:hypothetical protein [Longimicrobium terrae]MBB4639311.1 hypothetical protein [Longimicrobium terrae]MBB6073618.1 hypothetical protein [Longimicrobium terrae]NNC29376.1 hypothetical protein [Longimicrobium terrae]